MPNSLRCKIKKFAYQKKISENECKRIIHALDLAENKASKSQWEELADGNYRCSKCKHLAYLDSEFGNQLFEFCPYCGTYQNGIKFYGESE